MDVNGRELKEHIEQQTGATFVECASGWKGPCAFEKSSKPDSFLVFNSPSGEFYCFSCKVTGDFADFNRLWEHFQAEKRRAEEQRAARQRAAEQRAAEERAAEQRLTEQRLEAQQRQEKLDEEERQKESQAQPSQSGPVYDVTGQVTTEAEVSPQDNVSLAPALQQTAALMETLRGQLDYLQRQNEGLHGLIMKYNEMLSGSGQQLLETKQKLLEGTEEKKRLEEEVHVEQTRIAELESELERYLQGLAQGDFDLALRGLLGEEASVSADTGARLKAKWQVEFEEWQRRPLADLEVAYLWVDGIYVRAGLEDNKAALLTVIAGLSDGRKTIISAVAGHRESNESWSAVLQDLSKLGLHPPRLVIGDEHLGIWKALGKVWPKAAKQGCWNHKVLNVLGKVPRRHHKTAKLMLRRISHADTKQHAERSKREFQKWCRKQNLEDAFAVLDQNWERMLTFHSFPKTHWQHVRSSSSVVSLFSRLRLKTDAAKRLGKVENATAVVWKMLMVAEKKFRRLRAPERMKEVYLRSTSVERVFR